MLKIIFLLFTILSPNLALAQTEAASSTATTVKYGYDQNDNRVFTSTNGLATSTIVNQYFEKTGATSTKYIYANSQLIATIEGGSVYYNHQDHLSGSNVITNQYGTVAEYIDYYPFGAIRQDQKTSSFNEKKKFTGHYFDADTGLNYMMARYQNGGVGRFVSVDSVFNAMGDEAVIRLKTNMSLKKLLENPQALNSYSYSYNNPLIFKDQSGDFAFLAAPAAYLVAYAPVWVPAAITTVSAIGAGVSSWFLGESIGYRMEGSHQAANQSLGKAQATLGATAVGVGGVLVAGEAAGVNIQSNAEKSAKITEPYKRPSGATTRAQKDAMQGQPCSTCGSYTDKMYADHKYPLVKEYYETGKIDTQRMKSLGAVQPQCSGCSCSQGGQLSNYSKQMKTKFNLKK